MAIDVVFAGETIVSVGGRWDRRAASYDPLIAGTELGDPAGAEAPVIIEPHAGELPAILWFMSWLAVHAGRRDNPPDIDESALARLDERQVDLSEAFSALLAGGRRGGKTWTAALCCALYAILFPGALIWVVNPSDEKHDEVRRYFAVLLAPEWMEHEHSRGWDLINGSSIQLKSGYVGADPDAIKEGEAHLIWLNEGQKMAERVFIVARGAIVDRSGLVLICANPPVQAKDQQWVADFAAAAQSGRRMAAFFQFDPLKNPFINRNALMAMRYELDERTFRIEVLGEFLPPAEMVVYNWSRIKDGNERPMPEEGDPYWVDVTVEFLRFVEIGDGYTDLPGIDFQVHPWIGGPVYRIFMPRRDREMTRDNVVMWGVDEIVLEGDELDWCAEAKAKGYNPATTAIIGDGTGEYQHTRRGSVDSPPPTWHGKGSFDIMKMGGFKNIMRPDPRIPRNNPHVIDRVRALTSMVQSGRGRRLFLDPDRCPKTAKSFREWPTVHGKPSRTHPAAHLGDGGSYPVVRLFPRILRSEKPGQVDPITELVDNPSARPRGFGKPPATTSRPRHRRDRDRGL